MPCIDLYCPKCEHIEKDVIVEIVDKEMVFPKCEKCGTAMRKDYRNFQFGSKIKGWSPDKEAWAKRECARTQALMAEGFKSKEEAATAEAMYKEKYGNKKPDVKEQIKNLPNDIKKRL